MTAFPRLLRLALAFCALLAAPAAAQEQPPPASPPSPAASDDLFVTDEDVRVAQSGVEDLFAAGQSVTVSGNVGESVHALARRVRLTGSAGRDVYAAARDVELRGPVAGDVTAFGVRVELSGSSGDDVLLGGREIEVSGPVAGDAMLLGETVEIAAPISGSVRIRASEIRFGPAARIDGTLEYWTAAPVAIPAGVIAPDRVTFQRTDTRGQAEGRTPLDRGVAFGVGVLVMLALAAIFAALVPRRLDEVHDRAAERPWLNLLLGGVLLSGIFGSILVLAASIIGIPLIPVVILLAPVALLAAYLTAAFSLGRLSLGLAKAQRRDGWLGVFTAMAVGVVLLAILRLVPIFGWMVLVLAITAGLGAWFSTLLRPRTTPA